MKILIDTNVILDIVLARQPFVHHSARLLQVARQAQIDMYLTATTITDLYYIVRKAKDKQTAFQFIEDIMQFVEVATVNKSVILGALQSNIADFEDAIQAIAAKNETINIIVTRNEGDFAASQMEVYTPESFLKHITP